MDKKCIKAISSKTSLSSTTMTTTISKHDLQLQQLQQQQELMLLQQQQQQLLQLQLQQQQQQFFSQNTTYNLDNMVATAHRSDSITTTTLPNSIEIDTLNNNFENHFSATSNNFISQINNNNVNLGEPQPTKIQKKRSILNFKSFDLHIKSLYSGLRNGSYNQNKSHSQCTNLMADEKRVDKTIIGSGDAKGSESNINKLHENIHQPYNRMPPYLKIESVDLEEIENLLIDYPQSPYSSRRNSSNDDNRSTSQLIHLTGDGSEQQLLQQLTPHRYEMSRSQVSSTSRFYLSPYTFASSSQNIRRSSTSDIMSGSKRSASSSTSNSRRPSTSDLLRKARERRGSEARMGRSASHSGLPRGGGSGGAFRVGPGVGGRRTSIAF